MAKIIHAMLRVRNESASVSFYDTALGLKVRDRFEFDEFTLIYLRNDEADVELELTINHDRTEPYNLGDGYGHVAVAVDDLEFEYRRLLDAGLNVGSIKEMSYSERPLARFFFVVDPDGYKIEFLQRGGRYV